MAYLVNIYLEDNKFVYKALQDIRGIGEAKALKICASCGIGLDRKVKDIKFEEFPLLEKVLEKEDKLESKLTMSVQENIKTLVRIKAYRGRRHTQNLPNRGQRTHGNAKTRKRMDWRSMG